MDENRRIPFVSIVIALKNEEEYIGKCLSAFMNQTYPKTHFEILVYDGMSTDGSREIVKKLMRNASQIRFFDNQKEMAAAGWNKGFKASNADYVVMMGAHTVVEQDFIEENVKILENESACCTGGRVIAIGEDAKSRAIAFAFNHPFGAGDARYRFASKRCFVETVNYGMYRKSVIDAIGPINEDIKRGEDWEYNYRVVKRFGKMIYSPDIKSYYYSRSDFTRLWTRQFDAGFYKLDIIRKYPHSILLRHLIPFFFAAFILFIPFLFMAGISPYILITILVFHFLSNFIFSLNIVQKEGSLKLVPLVMWAFFVIQFAYGLGFFIGMIKLIIKASIGKRSLNSQINSS